MRRSLVSAVVISLIAIGILFTAKRVDACSDRFVLVKHYCSGCQTSTQVLACQGVSGDSCQDAATWVECGDNCMVGWAGPCDLPRAQAELSTPESAKRCGGSADMKSRKSKVQIPAHATGAF